MTTVATERTVATQRYIADLLIAEFAVNASLGKEEISIKKAEEIVRVVKSLFEKAIIDDNKDINIPGLGTLTVKFREGRKGRNPQTGAEIDIPAHRIPGFKVGKNRIKDVVTA